MKRKTVLKEAGVLLIIVVMVLSTVAVTANTANNKTVMLNTMNDRTVILYEGFEDGVMPPVGWSVYDYGEEGWGITTDSFSGENAAYWMGSVASELISPTVDCSAMTEAYLSFWHKQPSLTKGQDTLSVYVSDNGGATWNMVADYNGDIQGYTHEMIDLSAYAGEIDVQVKFTATGSGGDGVYLDEIRLCDGYAGEFMGLEIAPLGVAELEVIRANLNISNCVSGQPETDGVWVNLEGYNAYTCTLENPFEPDMATTINFEVNGMIGEEPFSMGMELQRTEGNDNKTVVNVDLPYEMAGSPPCWIICIGPNDDIVFYKEVDEIGELGYLTEVPEDVTIQIPDAVSSPQIKGGGYSVSTGVELSEPVLWTWEEHDVYNLTISKLMVIGELEGSGEAVLSDTSITATGIDEFTMLEHYAYEIESPAEPGIDGPTEGNAGTAYTYQE